MIKEFKEEYSWLSNFHPVIITLDGIEYASVEHAYMSAKSIDYYWKLYCQIEESPGKVKKESRFIQLIENWEDIKVSVMAECLKQKFNQEPFKSLLLSTGEEELQEGNVWGDTFWGVDLRTGVGANTLGFLIMQIRETLKQGSQIV